MKKITLYIVVAVVATIFFLYYQFPKEAIKAYIDYQVYQLNPDFRLAFGDLRLHYPPYLKVRDATVYHLQKPVITVSSAKIRTGRAIFFHNGTLVAFKGNVRDGRFEGKIHYDDGDAPQGTKRFEISLDGIRLEDIDGIRTIPAVSVSGRVEGKIVHVDKKVEPDEGQVDLILSDCTVQLSDAPFDVKSMQFNRIDMKLILAGQTLTINHLEMTGSQVNAQFNGNVNLQQPIQQTKLNLKGKVHLQAEFMARLKKKIPAPLWPNKKTLQNGLPIAISGTIDNPRLGMR